MTDAPSTAAHALQPVADADVPVLLALNNAAVPHVNELDAAALRGLLAEAAVAVKVVDAAGDVAGFVIAFRPGTSYASENYRWFCANMPDGFLYVDRIVVDPSRRRSGAARALYGHVFRAAEGAVPRVTCEVNVRPPNPGSLAFHEALGFQSVGEIEPYGGAKRVRLLARPVVAAASGA